MLPRGGARDPHQGAGTDRFGWVSRRLAVDFGFQRNRHRRCQPPRRPAADLAAGSVEIRYKTLEQLDDVIRRLGGVSI